MEKYAIGEDDLTATIPRLRDIGNVEFHEALQGRHFDINRAATARRLPNEAGWRIEQQAIVTIRLSTEDLSALKGHISGATSARGRLSNATAYRPHWVVPCDDDDSWSLLQAAKAIRSQTAINAIRTARQEVHLTADPDPIENQGKP